MTNNYDASKVGVPFVRAKKITIDYPDNNLTPSFSAEQWLAVVLADGTVRNIEKQASLNAAVDLANDGDDPIPLIHPTTGQPLGANTTRKQVMLGILAVLRFEQTRAA